MARKPHVANRFFVKLALDLYGNKYFNTKLKLIDDGCISTIQPPFVLLANHCGFADVGAIAKLLYPTLPSYVASDTQFVGKSFWLRSVGALHKKQFSLDLQIIRNIKEVLNNGNPVVIYPEGKVSVVGTPSVIQPSIAKLVKMLNVPVVTMRFDGSYLHKPRWAGNTRFVPVTITTKVITTDELRQLSTQQLYNVIVDNLTYDDYEYQLSNKIEIRNNKLAEGLEYVLYKCPDCSDEFNLTSKNNVVTCNCCHSKFTINSYGQPDGRFDKITDWYNWQKQQLTEQIVSNKYCEQAQVKVSKLRNNKYVNLGKGVVTSDCNGIDLQLKTLSLHFKRGLFYTLSFDNSHVFLPTSDTVYRLTFTDKHGITAKINLATEVMAQIDGSGDK